MGLDLSQEPASQRPQRAMLHAPRFSKAQLDAERLGRSIMFRDHKPERVTWVGFDPHMPVPRDLKQITSRLGGLFRVTANFFRVFPKQTRPITSLLKQCAMFRTCYAFHRDSRLQNCRPTLSSGRLGLPRCGCRRRQLSPFSGDFTVTSTLMVLVLRMRKLCSMALCNQLPCYPRLGVTQDSARFGGRQHCTGHWAPMSLPRGHHKFGNISGS